MSSYPIVRKVTAIVVIIMLANIVQIPPSDSGPGTTPVIGGTGPGRQNGTISENQDATVYSLLEGNEDSYGQQVTNLGDTDGDGKDDLIVSYFMDFPSSSSKPSAWGNYYEPGRTQSGFSQDMRERVSSVSTRWLGHPNRNLGDINGDGYSDMVSMTRTEDREWGDVNVTTPPSYVDVWYGSPNGIGDDPDVSIYYKVRTSDNYVRWYIPAYGGIGDVNGDGYDDLAILDEMDLVLFYGSKDGISTTFNSSVTLGRPDNARNNWGNFQSQFVHADVNGDGHSDLVLTGYYVPRITVYIGSAIGVSPVPYPIDEAEPIDLRTVHCPVDVNGDGYDDAIIEHGDHEGQDTKIDLEIYLGSSSGLSSKPNSTSTFWEGEDIMHSRNILFTDISGDGLDDFIIERDDPANWTVYGGEMNPYNEYEVFLNQGGEFPGEATYTFQVAGNFSGYNNGRWGLNDVGDFDGDGFGDAAIGIPGGHHSIWKGDWAAGDRNGYLLIVHGRSVMERLSNMVLVGEPTLYAAHSVGEIVANLAATEGLGPVRDATLTMDPGGANVELNWNAEVDGNPFSVVSDPLGCVELLSGMGDVETDPSTGEIRPHFKFRPGWEWPHEDPVDVELRIRTTNGELGPLPGIGMFNVVTSLEFQGPPTLRGEWQGLLDEGDWVRGGEQVNISDIRVVYAGSGDIEPSCNMTPVVMDNDGDHREGLYDSKYFWQVAIQMDEATDIDEVLTLSMKDLPGNAAFGENLTIHLPVDADLPLFGTPVPDDQDWHAITSVMVSITVDDGNGSGPDPATMEFSWRTRDAHEWSDWTREGLGVHSNGGQVEGLATLDLVNGDENRVRWRVKDLVGNGHAEFVQTIKVDTRNVSFEDPSPDPGEWLHDSVVECGVTITDLEGSGIDVSTIQFRISPRNLSQYSEWTDWDEGSQGNAETVTTSVLVELAESARNYIQWRAFDIAGNGLTTSPHYVLRVDMTPPIFEGFTPAPEEVINSTEVECEVTVRDNPLGSGVDLASVLYRYAF
ncbi:MAG: VCBS repeat-containing protein, partial [Thermoplasmata archaeon]|nr:VCBS repeat-containing protein [Thermoplasmata archaeon]